jgi:adenylate kinase
VILVLLGAPGAGKGTQAEALAAATGAAHVATGDLFRAEIAAGSELGRTASSFIDAGKLVPDEVTIGMISARLAKPDAAQRVILDGFPRNPAQVAALDAAFASSGRTISAILLNVDVSILTARLTGRRVCPDCGRSYHVAHRPPAVADRCDACGAALITRSDDAPATVAARLENQLAALNDVVELYRASDRLQVVEGVGEIREIQSRLAAAAAAVGFTA